MHVSTVTVLGRHCACVFVLLGKVVFSVEVVCHAFLQAGELILLQIGVVRVEMMDVLGVLALKGQCRCEFYVRIGG